MTELYWIATNRKLSLETRYAAVRQMQQNMRPQKPVKENQRYSKDAEKIILNTKGTKHVANALERTECAIKFKRIQLKKKGVRA